MTNNPGKVITFCQVFHEAWIHAMTMQNMITSFRITGVFPVDRTAVRTSDLLPSHKLVTDELHKRTGISFVPLYSPVVKKQHSVSNASFSNDEMLLFQ